MQKKHFLFLLLIVFIIKLSAQENSEVTVTGRMRDVMWQGKLAASIRLDTLDMEHAYGLGPVAYLKGEILLLDGIAYRSTVLDDKTMQVEDNFKGGAPFFGYAKITDWESQKLPSAINTLTQLESHLDKLAPELPEPFFFRLKCAVQSAVIHVVNLPEGSIVRSPDEAHQGLTKYPVEDKEVEILGFYSTRHKAILTHHDTNMHLHLITADKQQMGHVDVLEIKAGSAELLLPKSKQ